MNSTRTILFLGLAVMAAVAIANATPQVPVYQVGETARVDVLAAFDFSAIDPEQTRELRQKEARRVPFIYRFDTNALTHSISNLHEAFATNRQEFIARVQSTFKRFPLDERAMTNQRFQGAINSFRSRHRDFPLTRELAESWATGKPDVEHLAPYENHIRATLARYVRPEGASEAAKLNWNARVVPGIEVAMNATELARIKPIARTNIISMGTIRTEASAHFASSDRARRLFFNVLVPNCWPEEEVTAGLRTEAAAHLTSMNHFTRGDAVVRAGQVVDVAVKSALDEYRARLALVTGPVSPRLPTTLLLWGSAGTAVVLLAAVVWWMVRRRSAEVMLVPASLGDDTVAALRNDPVIRARLTEHLTRLLGQSVVQRLLSQRNQLVTVQNAAAAETAEMEQRLGKVQIELQQRFAAYEQRIAELEKELGAAEEQSRDLILARIAATRQELEAERARHRVDWN